MPAQSSQQISGQAPARRAPTTRGTQVRLWAPFVLLALLPLITVFPLDPAKSLTQYTHDAWSEQADLPQATVQVITQTSDGYLWLGTQEGLVRFDGVTFAQMNTEDTGSFAEGRDGTLWMSTYNGLLGLKDDRFVRLTKKEGLSSNHLNAVCEDSSGTLWVGTDSGLNRVRQGKITAFHTADGLPSDEILDVLAGRGGAIWMATRGGLARYEEGRFTVFTKRDGLPTDDTSRLFQDAEGTLWIGTNGGGLCALRKGRLTTYGRNEGLPSGEITAIHEDRDGSLWIGTGASGLVRMRDGRFEVYTSREGLSDNGVWSIFEDREGSLWVGTFGGGLNRLKDEKFTTYDASAGLSNNTVWCVYETKDRTLWIGTDTGLNAFRDGRFQVYSTKDGLPHEGTSTLFEDGDGTLWVGSERGLAFFKSGKFKAIGTKDGLSNPRVFCFCEDRKGNLWIGTGGGGLNLYKNGKFSVFRTKDGLADDHVRALLEDREGNLWIGTNSGGLSRFRDGSFSTFTTKDGLSGNFIRCLYEDREGTLWIGTREGGLTRYKNGKFTAFQAKDGLVWDTVYQILEDGRGNLWMSSNKGVRKVAKKDLEDFASGKISTIQCSVYGRADGMKSAECNGGVQSAGCKTRDGRLWFPTIRGVVSVDPQHLKLNEVPPPVHIQEFLVDGKPASFRNRVAVPPGSDRLEFRFTALSLFSPEKVRFSYFLQGHDQNWIALEPGRERAAVYTNLPPGRYTFRVKACNNDGVWNEAGDSLAFVLKPRFTQTLFFYAIVSLSLLLLGGVLYHVAGLWLTNLRIGRSLARYHSRQVLEKLRATKGTEVSVLASERRRITILFSDLTGFSDFSDRNEPEVVNHVINDYLTEMALVIEAQGGTVARFMGDGIMAFFGAPGEMEPAEQARRAVAAAASMQRKMAELRESWLRSGLDHDLKMRVGISQDYATVGNFGSKDLMEYTALGSAVNLASRLETACAPGRILVSFPVYTATRGLYAYGEPEQREFKGFARPVHIAELDPSTGSPP